jgi:outer membrane protein OmpA-like peptidoglycan-associated protein
MMNRLLILVGFTLQFSMLFAQNDCNKNLFTEEEALMLSDYGKKLENAILEHNPADSALIAIMQEDLDHGLCGYTDEEVVKISNYLKVLEKQDSLNNIVEEVIEDTTSLNEVVEVEQIDSVSTPTIEIASVETASFDNIVLFKLNSAKIVTVNLDGLVSKMKENRNAKILLVGHTDSSGSDNLNLNLSIQRATAVKRYLINKGVQGARIRVKGEGESKPVGDNNTKEGRAKNRRVEITVK